MNVQFAQHHLLKEKVSEVAQSSLTLCDPVDCSPPGSSVHGIFQARVLEWGAIAFSRFIESLLLILHRSGIVRGSLRLPSQNTITVCLIKTEILCFSVLEGTSPKSSCQQDQVPSQTYCRDSSLPLSSLWWFAGNPWHFSMQQQHFSLCLLIICFSPNKSVLRCPSSYKDTSNTGLRAHPITFRLENESVSHSAMSDSL